MLKIHQSEFYILSTTNNNVYFSYKKKKQKIRFIKCIHQTSSTFEKNQRNKILWKIITGFEREDRRRAKINNRRTMIKTKGHAKEEEKGNETSAGKWEKFHARTIKRRSAWSREGRMERNSEKFEALHTSKKRKREKHASWISVNRWISTLLDRDRRTTFLRLRSSRLEEGHPRIRHDGTPISGNLGSFMDKYMILLANEIVEAQTSAYSVLSWSFCILIREFVYNNLDNRRKLND